MAEVSFTQHLPMPDSSKTSAVRQISEKLEANFLAEMLKHAKFGEPPESFGGGTGEEQFASFFRQSVADEIAANGGIGLAETIFSSIIRSTEGVSND